MKKKTNEQFIEESRIIHNDEYDYSLVDYKGNKIKVKIICKEHGVFEQLQQDHQRKHKCPVCRNNKRYNNNEFIEKCKKIYPSENFDYSQVDYRNNKTNLKIICSEHGIFEVRPDKFLQKRTVGCKKCWDKVYDTDSFIKKSNIVHKNKFDYSQSTYIGNNIKLKIICEIHGVFEQTPHNHLKGYKCPNCSKNKKMTNEDFIKKANIVHDKIYDYGETKYINCSTKVKIRCEKHGIFEQTPSNHLDGCGCQICKNSRGEKRIRNYLLKNNIIFDSEKRFNNCKNVISLPFDFFLPQYNSCIEFDGEQHFFPKEIWGGTEGFEKTKNNDRIKNEYCLDNNIKLIRINFKEINSVEEIVRKNIILSEYKWDYKNNI